MIRMKSIGKNKYVGKYKRLFCLFIKSLRVHLIFKLKTNCLMGLITCRRKIYDNSNKGQERHNVMF